MEHGVNADIRSSTTDIYRSIMAVAVTVRQLRQQHSANTDVPSVLLSQTVADCPVSHIRIRKPSVFNFYYYKKSSASRRKTIDCTVEVTALAGTAGIGGK